MTTSQSEKIQETLGKPKCPDWRAVFLSDDGEKSQAYFVYVKILRRNQAEKVPSRRVRQFARRFP